MNLSTNDDQKSEHGDLLFWATRYFDQKKYQKSLLIFIKLLHIHADLKCPVPFIMHNIGICFYHLKDFENALKWFSETIQYISKNHFDFSQIIISLQSMAQTYQDLEDYVHMDIFIHIAKSLTIASTEKSTNSKLSLQRLALFHKLLNFIHHRNPLDLK